MQALSTCTVLIENCDKKTQERADRFDSKQVKLPLAEDTWNQAKKTGENFPQAVLLGNRRQVKLPQAKVLGNKLRRKVKHPQVEDTWKQANKQV